VLIALHLNIFNRQKTPLQKSDLVNLAGGSTIFQKVRICLLKTMSIRAQKMKNFLKGTTATK